jgi:hypothetical protein
MIVIDVKLSYIMLANHVGKTILKGGQRFEEVVFVILLSLHHNLL